MADEVLRLLTPIYDERVERWLVALEADSSLSTTCRGAIIRYLVERGSGAGVELARECVTHSGEDEASRGVGRTRWRRPVDTRCGGCLALDLGTDAS